MNTYVSPPSDPEDQPARYPPPASFGRTVPLFDYLATGVTLLFLLDIMVMSFLGKEVDSLIREGFALSLGWLFRGVASAVSTYKNGR